MPNIAPIPTTHAEAIAEQEWRRLPLRGGRFFGLTRTALNELCLSGAIESRLIKRKNAQRGIRLFRTASLQEYLDNGGETNIEFPQCDGRQEA